MNTNVARDLTALLAQLDALADAACRAGDEKHERYYYGVMFGLETARDELAAIVAAAQQEIISISRE